MRYCIEIKYFFLLVLFLSISVLGNAQKDTIKDRIQIINADFLNVDRFNGKEIQYLYTDIIVLHKKTYLFCDSAIIEGNKMRAWSHVRIVEGDSLQIYCDTLNYNGDLLQAECIGNVVLRHHDRQLFTPKLDYDLKKRIASYYSGGQLASNTTHLTSKRGYYYAKQEQAYFKDSVNVILENNMNLQSDSLVFDAKNQKVIFTGPTNIQENEMSIYTEDGYHDVVNQHSYFNRAPHYTKGSQKADAQTIQFFNQENVVTLKTDAWVRDSLQEAKGDSIYINNATDWIHIIGHGFYKDKDRELRGEHITYNKKSKSLQVSGRTTVNEGKSVITADQLIYSGDNDLGTAFGHVVYEDTSSGFSIICDTFYYNKKDERYIPIGNKKYIASPFDNDTLYMTADSLIAETRYEVADTFKVLLAFKHVKMWSKKMQGLCDSLFFDSRDSVFRLYYDPVMWSDTSQFSGDTIFMYLKNKALDQIHINQKAFIINDSQVGLTNQVKGRNIVSFFVDKKLNHVNVDGNAESVYFIQDESNAYIGANIIQCSQMKIVFNDAEKIDKIHFYTKPEGKMVPVKDGKLKFLDGFENRSNTKPTSLQDILK
ncbi:MAG: hypothetical protein IPK88_08650 [Saprospiraceae bacterium]|nr:hypothetical protein [Candidatus Defluviibacterium haderslevense]